MQDYSNLTNVTGNAQRGTQSPSNAFAGLGSQPLNIMPQNGAAQPGMNLGGMLNFLGNTFSGQPRGLLSYMASAPPGGNLPSDSIGSSLFQLGQIFGASRQPPPQWASQQGFGAPSYYNSPTRPPWGGPR